MFDTVNYSTAKLASQSWMVIWEWWNEITINLKLKLYLCAYKYKSFWTRDDMNIDSYADHGTCGDVNIG